MKILVTGGAGYIGAVLVPLLLREGHEVIVVDNFMYQQAPLLDVCCDPKLTIVRGDVRHEKMMAEQYKKADAIFPLACLTGAPLCDKDPRTAEGVILDAIIAMLKVRRPDQIIIYPTTNSGYGIGQKGVACTEESPLSPISLYGKLKVDAEKRILDAGNSVALRLATAFGLSPRMRLDLLVNDFTYRAVYDGFIVLFEAEFKRNFIHVRDVAKAFVHALKNFQKMKNQAYNVGLSDANLSKRELCEEIKKQIPRFQIMTAPVGEDPDKRDYVVSNAKIEATGFKPDCSLPAGITELVKGYQIIKRQQYANV